MKFRTWKNVHIYICTWIIILDNIECTTQKEVRSYALCGLCYVFVGSTIMQISNHFCMALHPRRPIPRHRWRWVWSFCLARQCDSRKCCSRADSILYMSYTRYICEQHCTIVMKGVVVCWGIWWKVCGRGRKKFVQ